mmetsp:Transcript_85895/g.237943  ORF Transcript_85895/g.237943 Transcript_85895/m.237943 type:complete len:475 (+) Transcript_85895:66-1490(+)
MITYKKGCGGIYVLLQSTGTSWTSGVLPGLISASISLILNHVGELNSLISNGDTFFDNPYPFQLFAYMVGFVIVFRTNFAYQRYWEALDAVQRMGAKWFDCACMAIAFDAPGDISSPYLVGDNNPEPPREAEVPGCAHAAFFNEIVHLFSLLHALALQHLRSDPDLSNLQLHRSTSIAFMPAPAPSASGQRGHKGFNRAGEDKRPSAVGGLAAFCEVDTRMPLPVQKLEILGKVKPEELLLLEASTRRVQGPTLARVAMVQSWIMRRLVARQKYEPRGDMGRTSSPILSRLYQVICDGHLGFSHAAKVSDNPFPFPYHNLIRMLLWMYVLSAPFVINSKVFHVAARLTLSFTAVWAYFALCEVGDNLEDPFRPSDPNELPLQAIQRGFNARLLSLSLVPARSPACDAERCVDSTKVIGSDGWKEQDPDPSAADYIDQSDQSSSSAEVPCAKNTGESPAASVLRFTWADYYRRRL